MITRVRKQIIELLDEDKYIEAKVYFKPKKLSENGKLEFRPLHSTDLITQIAIVSMLHLFVYEIPEEERIYGMLQLECTKHLQMIKSRLC